jgi:hypothetical protein
MPENLDTNAKALKINLDPVPYGTFAEIGGGQEVSRWFFRVGGAAGTVAKTISAYDMSVSDAIYGSGERYVSRERLRSMLDHEFSLLIERLRASRGDKTAFFVFADTVATRNFKGTNECHGWIGLRLQHAPGAPPSDVFVHVSLRDPTAAQQQQSLGILGVNLIFAAVYLRDARAGMLRSLLDGLTMENLEIDVIECSGPAFADYQDHKSLALEMLEQGLTQAVVFDEHERMEQPSTVFRKRGLLVHRCSMRRDNPELERMLAGAIRMLKAETPDAENEPLALLELSISGVLGEGRAESPDVRARLDRIIQPGRGAMITNYPENFRISGYLRRYSNEPVRFVVGLDSVVTMLGEQFYAGIDGGVLEGLGRLLAPNVRIYVFSMPAKLFRERVALHGIDTEFCRTMDVGMLTVSDVRLAPPVGHLLDFLRDAKWVIGAELPAR